MQIATPTKSGEPIYKDVVVGGGVAVRILPLRYSMVVEVMEIDEDVQQVRVKGPQAEGWVSLDQILDAMPPSQFAIESAMHNADIQESE